MRNAICELWLCGLIIIALDFDWSCRFEHRLRSFSAMNTCQFNTRFKFAMDIEMEIYRKAYISLGNSKFEVLIVSRGLLFFLQMTN